MGAIRAVAVAGALLLVAGCGFHPLNGRDAEGASPVADMAQVKIGEIYEVYTRDKVFQANARYDQILRNRLLDRFNPDGEPSAPTYVLRVNLSESSTETGIQPDGTAARTDVSVSAHFRLIKLMTGTLVTEGDTASIDSYPIVINSYATLVDSQDAQKRAVLSVADDIARRVALYFHAQDGKTP